MICSADHTATQTIGHSSIDISVIRDTQRPWSFVQNLCRDEIRGWWWWWWWTAMSHVKQQQLQPGRSRSVIIERCIKQQHFYLSPERNVWFMWNGYEVRITAIRLLVTLMFDLW